MTSEIKVNECFTIGKDTYKCIDQPEYISCSVCDLPREGYLCEEYECTFSARSDYKAVIFVLVDQEEE